MSARAGANGITYAAVTATPKAKTLALTGRRPDPDRQHDQPAQSVPRLSYAAGHRERVILDVLKNYTPYSLAFRLAGAARRLTRRKWSGTRPPRQLLGVQAAPRSGSNDPGDHLNAQNAVVESFFNRLKRERIRRENVIQRAKVTS